MIARIFLCLLAALFASGCLYHPAPYSGSSYQRFGNGYNTRYGYNDPWQVGAPDPRYRVAPIGGISTFGYGGGYGSHYHKYDHDDHKSSGSGSGSKSDSGSRSKSSGSKSKGSSGSGGSQSDRAKEWQKDKGGNPRAKRG